MSGATVRRILRLVAWAWALAATSLIGGLVATDVLGFRFAAVHSGSMYPTLPVGSAVLLDESVSIDQIEANDVVMFNHDQSDRLVLHRVVAVNGDRGAKVMATRGDANSADDLSLVTANELRGRMVLALPELKPLIQLITTSAGIAVLLVIPIILFLVDSLVLRRQRRIAT